MKTKRSVGMRVDSERLRFAVFSGMMLFGLVYLVLSLYQIQVTDTAQYSDAQDAHSFRRVRLPATRGRILDRNGVVLADNKPSYCVALYIEELRKPGAWENTVTHVDALVADLARIIDKPREVDRDDIWAHIKRRRPIPLFAFTGLDDAQMARLAEWPGALPGTDIYVGSERIYPFADTASHIIGYVGRGQPREVEEASEVEDHEDFNFYMPDLAGREGIEYACDLALGGRGGGHLIRVNAVGYKHEMLPGRPAVPGLDVMLTLDSGLQRTAEQALGDNRGAAVVLDCENGDILAMANSPRYDLRLFVPVLTSETWNRLLKDPAKPLYNRASSGIYPPGSVLKPVVALCGLRAHIVEPDTRFTCTGSIRVGQRIFHCANRYGHGEIGLQRAIAASCNPYFIDMALQMGFEPVLHDEFAMLGFGTAPRIGVQTASGLLPSSAWKQGRFGDSWRGGDTANFSLGQGFLSTTPLQIAMMTATLAMDGKMLKPRLIRDAGDGNGVQQEPVAAGVMNWPKSALSVVKAGMHDAINAPYGTGRRAAVPGIDAAGKTGTAEYYENSERKKHAWMIAFAPFDAPRYAVAVVCEDADSGGLTAAAVLRELFVYLFPDSAAAPLETPELI